MVKKRDLIRIKIIILTVFVIGCFVLPFPIKLFFWNDAYSISLRAGLLTAGLVATITLIIEIFNYVCEKGKIKIF